MRAGQHASETQLELWLSTVEKRGIQICPYGSINHDYERLRFSTVALTSTLYLPCVL